MLKSNEKTRQNTYKLLFSSAVRLLLLTNVTESGKYSRYDDIATTRDEHSVSTMCSKLRGTVNVCVIQYLLWAACWEYVFPEYDGNYVE